MSNRLMPTGTLKHIEFILYIFVDLDVIVKGESSVNVADFENDEIRVQTQQGACTFTNIQVKYNFQ